MVSYRAISLDVDVCLRNNRIFNDYFTFFSERIFVRVQSFVLIIGLQRKRVSMQAISIFFAGNVEQRKWRDNLLQARPLQYITE